MEDIETTGGGDLRNNIYDTLYLFTIFILPFLGYISSMIYTSEEGLKWYKNTKFVLLDIGNSSYGLFFTLFIYLFAGMGIIYISNYYLGDGRSPIMSNRILRYGDPMRNIEKFWDCIMLCAMPLGFLFSWISQPLMLQYQSLVIPGALSVISAFLFLLSSIYMIKVHWLIMVLFLPLCIWSVYMSIFYFLPENKDSGGSENTDTSNDNSGNGSSSNGNGTKGSGNGSSSNGTKGSGNGNGTKGSDPDESEK